MHARSTLIALALLAAGASAQANDLLDQLKEKAGEAATSNSARQRRRICARQSRQQPGLQDARHRLQHHGQRSRRAAVLREEQLPGRRRGLGEDKLLAKITGQKKQETGFASGAKGLLQGGDGKSLNFKGLSSKVKEKACDYVLKNASSLI